MAYEPDVKIRFGKSRSKYYDDVVAHCKRMAASEDGVSYRSTGSGQDIRHVISFNDGYDAKKIWDRVKNWKSASMTIDGLPADGNDLYAARQRQNQALTKKIMWVVAIIFAIVTLLSAL